MDRNAIINEATAAHAEYPQYAGYYDGWESVRIVSMRGFRPRARRMWSIGYETIGKKRENGEVIVYHRETRTNCMVGIENAEFI